MPQQPAQTGPLSAEDILQERTSRAAQAGYRYGLFITTVLLIQASWVFQMPWLVEHNPLQRALLTTFVDVHDRLEAGALPPPPPAACTDGCTVTLAAGHPLYLAIIWSLWLTRLFALQLLAPRAEHMPQLHRVVRAFHMSFGWVYILLHELSHAVVALLTGYRITRFIVRWDGGYVGTFGPMQTHWIWLMAPLLWWWWAMQGVYLLATHTLPWWLGAGIATALPLLFAAGKPSGGDVVNAGAGGWLIVGGIDVMLMLGFPIDAFFFATGNLHL